MTRGLLILLFTASITIAQDAPPAPPPEDATAETTPEDDPRANAAENPRRERSFWPTEEIIERRIKWAAARRAREYDLSEEQKAQLEEALLERWPAFIEKHEEDIKPLMNEMIRARFADEPPEPDKVADWAERALPMLELFKAELAASDEEIGDILTDEQRAEFQRDRQRMRENLGEFEQRLNRWKEGEFDPKDWPGNRRDRRNRDRERREGAGAPANAEQPPTTAPTSPESEIDAELAAWEAYVRSFCQTYQLDRMQRNTAFAILKEMQERAEGYKARRKVELARLERMLTGQESATREEVEAEIRALYGPIDQMFKELEERLQAIPTSAQIEQAQPDAEAGKGHNKANREEAPESDIERRQPPS